MDTARSLCTPGETSCTHPSIDTTGDDEGFIGLLCTPDDTSAFAVVNSFGRESTLYNYCPSGMWAIFNFGVQTTGDFDVASCQDDVSGRTCTSQTYSLYGNTYTNPAYRCQINSCDGGTADTKQLNTLCMCLPGHYRTGDTCTKCPLGTIETSWMTECQPCPASFYCPDPAMGMQYCGSDQYYCPGGTSARLTVSVGYYSTGKSSAYRTGQSICEVCGLDEGWCEGLASCVVTGGPGFPWSGRLVTTAVVVGAMSAEEMSTTAPAPDCPSHPPYRPATTALAGAPAHVLVNLHARCAGWLLLACSATDKPHSALVGGVLLLERREARMRRQRVLLPRADVVASHCVHRILLQRWHLHHPLRAS